METHRLKKVRFLLVAINKTYSLNRHPKRLACNQDSRTVFKQWHEEAGMKRV